jgi:leader peptidase (prepilin peptidase) / N-methyltransferase
MLTLIIIGVLGLVAGSFVNAWVWRVFQQEALGKSKNANAQKSDLSVLRGRSQCPDCGQKLSAKDLVPILSWLALKGRCRYCQAPISRQYPLVELMVAAVFIVSWVYWPDAVNTFADWLQLGSWLVVFTGLAALLVYDLRWMLLPNRIVYPTLALAAAGRTLYIGVFEPQPLKAIGLWLASVAIASGFFWLLFQISRGRWIGYGDVRLGLITGTMLAKPELAGFMILLASVIGSLVILPLLLSGRKELSDKIPFGPFLIVGALISLLFGRSLIDWYQRLLT